MRLRMDTIKRLRALGAQKKVAGVVKVGRDQSKTLCTSTTGPPADTAATMIKTRPSRVKKNTLNSAPMPPVKFRKRQIHKTWLPTHLYHAKRAHMTSPKDPLWRFAIPMTSTIKGYRPTHRASNDRGAIAWDASYMSSLGLEGAENSIQGVLRALGVGNSSDSEVPWGSRGQKWRKGARVWQGWLYERDGFPAQPIAPAIVIWRSEEESDKAVSENVAKKSHRQVLIRVHPSTFLQVWEQVIRLAKVQKPPLVAEDLRFEIGSIDIVGPGSTEALLGALWPVKSQTASDSKTAVVEDLWPKLAGVQNPAMLPLNALLSFDISDPRLHHPPRTVQLPPAHQPDQLLHVLAQWPCDVAQTSPGLFSRKRRLAACRLLQSQKRINRRKAAATPGDYPEPLPEDARIPIMLFPSSQQNRSRSSVGSGNGRQSTWTLLLPWKAVPAVWQSIMYYPLSTGGQVRLGGLAEQRQIAFESGVPWFPGDYPGTKAGDAWEADESTKRRQEWERRPKGKRPEWSSVALGAGRRGEIGDGWACDWARLIAGPPGTSVPSPPEEPRSTKATVVHAEPYHLSSSVARSTAKNISLPSSTPTTSSDALVNVRVTLLTRGVATPCARIYRLPEDPTSRPAWLALDPSQKNSKVQKKAWKRDLPSTLFRGVPQEKVKERLAADLLQPPSDLSVGGGYPEVPGEEDLIGFVTTGEFCLTEGKGVGIGSVLFRKLANGGKQAGRTEGSLCIVRNAGEGMGRLARWEMV